MADGEHRVQRADQGLRRRHGRGGVVRPLGRGRRVRRPRRALRLRQDHRPAHDRRPRDADRRRGADRGRDGQRRRPAGPEHRDGLPELRALPAHVGVRQHGLRAAAARAEEARDPRARAARGRDARPDRPAEAEAGTALRRPAPARRDGPGDRARARRAPDGRAALEPRREAARGDAGLRLASCTSACARRPSTSPTTRRRR